MSFPIPTVAWETLGIEYKLFIHTVRAHDVFYLFSFDSLIATDILIRAYRKSLWDWSGFSFQVCSVGRLPTPWSMSSDADCEKIPPSKTQNVLCWKPLQPEMVL